MYKYMIIYKKHNGTIRYSVTKNKPLYQLNDRTSMGWQVIDILRLHNGKTYTIQEYNLLSEFKYRSKLIITSILKSDFIKLIELLFLLLIVNYFVKL